MVAVGLLSGLKTFDIVLSLTLLSNSLEHDLVHSFQKIDFCLDLQQVSIALRYQVE